MTDYNREYENYLYEYHRIPYHIKRKLENMPNNKGFICNGIWLFGMQKGTSNKIIIMFEKIYPNIYIHEITMRNYKITCMDLITKEKYTHYNQCRKKFKINELQMQKC